MGKSWRTRERKRTLAVALASATFAGCFNVETTSQKPSPNDARLASRVETALAGRTDDALAYAALYAVLADRLAAKRYDTTTEAASIAGRAAEILAVPGVLREIVNDELNPLLGKPQPITAELAAQTAAKLRALSDVCREAAQ